MVCLSFCSSFGNRQLTWFILCFEEDRLRYKLLFSSRLLIKDYLHFIINYLVFPGSMDRRRRELQGPRKLRDMALVCWQVGSDLSTIKFWAISFFMTENFNETPLYFLIFFTKSKAYLSLLFLIFHKNWREVWADHFIKLNISAKTVLRSAGADWTTSGPSSPPPSGLPPSSLGSPWSSASSASSPSFCSSCAGEVLGMVEVSRVKQILRSGSWWCNCNILFCNNEH